MALSPLPANLRASLQNPDTPWMLSPRLFERVQGISAEQNYKSVELLPTDPEAQFVLKYFEHSKPPHYSIKKIHVIHNPAHTSAFEAGIKTMNEEVNNPKSKPAWDQETCLNERKKVIQRWKEFTGQFSPFEIPSPKRRDQYVHVKVAPVWHGSNQEVCKLVCASNFMYFGKHQFFTSASPVKQGSTDIGYFGSGIYFTNSARYAAMYSSQGILLLSWTSMREPYPVVSDVPHPDVCSDMEKLRGREHYQNYNAHYIPVASIKPEDPNCMVYYPCYFGQTPAWDELVVFEKSQALPRFWVELGVDLPLPVSPAPESQQMSEGEMKKKTFTAWLQKAETGDPEAQYQVALCYLRGKGTVELPKEAVKWLEKAAEKNHTLAIYHLGVCHATGLGVTPSDLEAFNWWMKAAQLGLAEAQGEVGACLFKGTNTLPSDEKEAVKWYRKASEQNLPHANYYLGSCLVHGRGTERNIEEGLKLYHKAAEQGVAAASYYLGCFYRDGKFVKKDRHKAIEYLQKAADLGDKDARKELSSLLTPDQPPISPREESFRAAQRSVAEKDFSEAEKNYRIAALQGHREAQYQLGVLLFKGQGVPKNEKEAALWYRKAADQNHPLATYYFGSCLLHGRGISPDADQGLKLYFKAAEQGVIAAQYYLGIYYIYGTFLDKDIAKGTEWLQKAAAQGDKDAKFELEKFNSTLQADTFAKS